MPVEEATARVEGRSSVGAGSGPDAVRPVPSTSAAPRTILLRTVRVARVVGRRSDIGQCGSGMRGSKSER